MTSTSTWLVPFCGRAVASALPRRHGLLCIVGTEARRRVVHGIIAVVVQVSLANGAFEVGDAAGGRHPLNSAASGACASDISCVHTATRRLVETVDQLYLERGLKVHKVTGVFSPVTGGALGSRVLEITPTALALAGCSPTVSDATRRRRSGVLGPSEITCRCLRVGPNFPSAWGLMDADIELFVRLRGMLRPRTNVFVIGNAFGYSTLVLGLLFASRRGVNQNFGGGKVDVIDAEVATTGICDQMGSLLTRALVNASDLDVALSLGFSPRDVPNSMRSATYDLAFVDGNHTPSSLHRDFAVLAPRMAPRAVVVLHDVLLFGLLGVVKRLPRDWKRRIVQGRFYQNHAGTVLLHRGFPHGSFEDV
eukprot:TRINITY_DN58222_c0_g1_i1.p1 TRINITY_DN58222_c0_g1~~TRINITY_DN58222_c0_g1_i1.p1  ORF type:complete len:365 (-),score=48.40 TRINITY_DN58222_c0_g1_i1:98-1192(-)